MLNLLRNKPHISKIDENKDTLLTIETTCPFCKVKHIMYIDPEDYLAWQFGTLIQKAFPTLSKDDRERLITGICPKCWDKTFGGDE